MKRSLLFDELVVELEALGDQPVRTAFLARGIHAIAEVARRLNASELGAAVASPTNASALMTALAQPGAIGLLKSDDPLAGARLRGILSRERLLAAEGGVLGVEEVASLLHMTRQAVDKRRAAGKLIAVSVGRRGYLYPAWQFVDAGLLHGLEDILEILADEPPLAQIGFFLSQSDALGDERPLDLLRRGDLEPVRRSARLLGDQGPA